MKKAWRRQKSPPAHRWGFGILLGCVVGCGMIADSPTLQAQSPQSSQVQVSGVVPGPAPTQAAVIEIPANGQHFSISKIYVSGSCPAGTTVEIYKNDIFAGSANCVDEGFSLQISLVPSRNELVAKVKDALDQYGPDSSPVIVTYDRPQATPSPVEPSGRDLPGSVSPKVVPLLLVTTDTIYRGAVGGQPLSLRVEIIGGRAPYATRIEWGDGKSDLVPRDNSGDFWIRHTYGRQGVYEVVITATDSVGQSAHVQTVVIVNGEAPASVTVEPPFSSLVTGSLWRYLIYALVVLFITISSYQLGRHRAYRRMRRQGYDV